MAGPAGHSLHAAEVGAIDGGHHLHHPARGLLSRRVDHEIRLIGAGVWVTVRTVETKIRRDESHARYEVVDAELLERAGCDVLEGLSRLLPRGRRRRLALCRGPLDHRKTTQPQARQSSANNQPPRDLHVCSSARVAILT